MQYKELSVNFARQSTMQVPIRYSIERLQALADISRSSLCCYSNETRANPPNSAQLEGTPYHFLDVHPGPCSSVKMR